MKLSTPFYHAVGGQAVSQLTDVEIVKSNSGLMVNFVCHQNPYLQFNRFTQNNDPLWQQEVLEIFISSGLETPQQYIEFQINPNNALFLARVTNPNGVGPENSLEMIDPASYSFENRVFTDVDLLKWSGSFTLPFSLIGAPNSGYRANIYRIIRTAPVTDNLWRCHPDNSTFACWRSTQCLEKPTFHKPSFFGQLIF